MLKASVVAWAAMAAVGAGAGWAEEGLKLQYVASTGMVIGNGKVTTLVSWPVINDREDVAFVAYVEKRDPRLTYTQGVYVQDVRGKMRLALASGQSLGGAETVGGMAALALSEDGYVAAKVSMEGGAGKAPMGDPSGFAFAFGMGDAIVRVAPDGTMKVAAKASGVTVGIEGGTHLTLPDTPGIGKEGRMIFSGGVRLNGKAAGGALWRMEADGTVTLLARQRGAAEGVEGKKYGTMFLGEGTLAEDGTTMFQAYVETGAEGEPPSHEWGVWRVDGAGKVEPLLYSWAASPLEADEKGNRGTLRMLESSAMNASGQMAFGVTTEKTRVGGGVFVVEEMGKLRQVASVMTKVAGPKGEQMRPGSFKNVVINNKGKVAFVSWCTGEGKGGPRILMENGEGKLISVAGVGDDAPGAEAAFKFLDAPQFCATGQVAFTGTLEDGKKGLWMTDSGGTLRLIALTGTKFEGGNNKGVLKDVSIASVAGSSQSGGGDGRMRAMNNNGVLAFYLFYEDKSAVIYTGKFVNR